MRESSTDYALGVARGAQPNGALHKKRAFGVAPVLALSTGCFDVGRSQVLPKSSVRERANWSAVDVLGLIMQQENLQETAVSSESYLRESDAVSRSLDSWLDRKVVESESGQGDSLTVSLFAVGSLAFGISGQRHGSFGPSVGQSQRRAGNVLCRPFQTLRTKKEQHRAGGERNPGTPRS